MLNQSSILKLLPVFFAVILSVHLFNFPFYLNHTLVDQGPTWYGIDVSWQKTMNYELMKAANWGKDAVYTHGPLGFFATRVGWGISRWIFLLFDLFVVVNFFFVFRDFITRSFHPVLAICSLFAVTLLMNTSYGGELPWVLLLFIFYWMYRSFEQLRFSFLMIAAVLITVSFFIKMNTGLLGMVFFAAHLANMVLFKKIKPLKALLAFSIAALMIILMCQLLHVSLFAYIKGSFEIIKGYNEVMYLEEEQHRVESNLKFLSRALVIIYLVLAYYLVREKRYAELIFSGMCIAFIFLLKKQCVVRNDIQHLSDFFGYAPLVLLCGNLFVSNGKWKIFFSSATALLIMLALLYNTERRPVDVAFKARYGSKKDYVRQFREFPTVQWNNQKDKRVIPQRVLNKIGNATIDIFPWDGEYLLQHRLNYTPRPVFQSFSAYTPYLQEINHNFYKQQAPNFVIFDYDAIDERYPFNEEPTLHLFLLQNYTIVDSFTSNERWRLLLEKKKNISLLNFNRSTEVNTGFYREIAVDSATLAKVFVQYNFKGKLRSMRYRPPRINLFMQASTGEWYRYKTSTELLKGGLFLERLIRNNSDFAAYFSQKDSLPSITHIRIEADTGYFKPVIKVEILR